MDLFETDGIKAYEIQEGNFTLRNYEVSILQDEHIRGVNNQCKRKKEYLILLLMHSWI